MIKDIHVLVIDDEENYLFILETLLQDNGYSTQTCNDPELALVWLEHHHTDIVITDMKMPKMDGGAIIEHIHKNYPHIPIIVLTAFGTIADAVQCMKEGVFYYLTKPFENTDLLLVLRSASELAFARKQYEALYTQLKNTTAQTLHANTKIMQPVLDTIARIQDTVDPVFIHGERGTGKNFLAEHLHALSLYHHGSFVQINCEIPDEQWLEKQFFGYTHETQHGTYKNMGLLEQAHKGTLLVEYIEFLPQTLQYKILHAIKESVYDVRIIATSTKPIKQLFEENLLCEDLYYFLSKITIYMPALRERREDIPLLTDAILNTIAKKHHSITKVCTPEALYFLTAYEWVGNIDELVSTLEQAYMQTTTTTIDTVTLPVTIQNETARFSSAVDLLPISLNLADTLEKIEAQLIRRALVHANFVQSRAAALLGISKSRLQYKLMKYEITGHQLTYTT